MPRGTGAHTLRDRPTIINTIRQLFAIPVSLPLFCTTSFAQEQADDVTDDTMQARITLTGRSAIAPELQTIQLPVWRASVVQTGSSPQNQGDTECSAGINLGVSSV